MPSILNFDQWQNSAGSIINTPLQVQHTIFTNQISTTSTSYTTAFSLTVTPKQSNSKWSIDANIVFSDNGRGYTTNNVETKFRLLNSFTGGYVSPAVATSYSDGQCFWGWDAELGYTMSDEANAYLIKTVRFIGEATGSTAGTPITFSLQWRVTGQTAFINRVFQSNNSGAGVSTLRVMEIAQ